MSTRLVVLAAVAGLLALVYLGRSEGPGAATSEGPRTMAPPPAPRERPPADPAALRNVFEYSDRAVAPLPDEAPVDAPVEPPPAVEEEAAPPEPVRFVGLVHRGGRVRAALAISGEVVVLAPGESWAGWTVEEIDSDAGVRVRGPDSTAILLPPPD